MSSFFFQRSLPWNDSFCLRAIKKNNNNNNTHKKTSLRPKKLTKYVFISKFSTNRTAKWAYCQVKCVIYVWQKSTLHTDVAVTSNLSTNPGIHRSSVPVETRSNRSVRRGSFLSISKTGHKMAQRTLKINLYLSLPPILSLFSNSLLTGFVHDAVVLYISCWQAGKHDP